MTNYTLRDSNDNIIPLNSYSGNFVSKTCNNLRDLTEKVIYEKAYNQLTLNNTIIHSDDEEFDIRMDAFDQVTTLASKVYIDHPDLSNFIIDCPFTPNFAFYGDNVADFTNELRRKTKVAIRGKWALVESDDESESEILQMLLTMEITFLRL